MENDKIKVKSVGRVTVFKNIEIVNYDSSDEESSDDEMLEKSLFQGHGTMLKHIPNVAHNLSVLRADQLMIFHKILFGERTKVDFIKRDIESFCGYVWKNNERSKVKERIDKCLNQMTLNLIDILNLTDKKSRTSENILRFLEYPRVNIENVMQCFVKVNDWCINECVENLTLLAFSSVIVCQSRLDAEDVSDYLTQKRVVASLVHEGMDRNVRKTEEDLFMECRRQILIITEGMLIGLKIPFRTQILNHSFPSYNEYLKRLRMGHKLITLVSEQSPRDTVARLKNEFHNIQVVQKSAWMEQREARVNDTSDAVFWGSNVWLGETDDTSSDAVFWGSNVWLCKSDDIWDH